MIQLTSLLKNLPFTKVFCLTMYLQRPWQHYKWVCVNEALKVESFANSLKCANVRPLYKKVDPFSKNNYSSMSILPLLLKVYERVIKKQVLNYF